jgi:hypothetical protein
VPVCGSGLGGAPTVLAVTEAKKKLLDQDGGIARMGDQVGSSAQGDVMGCEEPRYRARSSSSADSLKCRGRERDFLRSLEHTKKILLDMRASGGACDTQGLKVWKKRLGEVMQGDSQVARADDYLTLGICLQRMPDAVGHRVRRFAADAWHGHFTTAAWSQRAWLHWRAD